MADESLCALMEVWRKEGSASSIWSIRDNLLSGGLRSRGMSAAFQEIRGICNSEMDASLQHIRAELEVALAIVEQAWQASRAETEFCGVCDLPFSDTTRSKYCKRPGGGRHCQARARRCGVCEGRHCQDRAPHSETEVQWKQRREPRAARQAAAAARRTSERKAADDRWALPSLGVEASEMHQQCAPPSVLIFGPPGSGKSYMWRHLLWRLEKWLGASSVGRTAPFGIVAQNAGGSTLHSWAGLGYGNQTAQEIIESLSVQQLRRWREARVLGIDDCSPLDRDTFEKAEEVARRVKLQLTGRELFFGGLLLVINFDLAQLPPPNGLPLTLSRLWPRLTAPEHSKLVHCERNRRFEDNLWKELVSRVRENKITEIDVQVFQGIMSKSLPAVLRPAVRLVPRHDLAAEFVEARLAALGDVESNLYFEWYTEHVRNGTPGWSGGGECTLQIKVGVQVLHTENVGWLANGTMGTVEGFDSTWPVVIWTPVGRLPFKTTVTPLSSPSPTVGLADGEVRSRLPLILAESLSIHKALGMTLPSGEIECNGIWDFAQFYEAISRFRGADYVQILNFKPKVVKPPRWCLKEMDRLQNLAALQGCNLQDELASSTALWEEAESATAALQEERHSSRTVLCDTTLFIGLVYSGVAYGASYYDPGAAAGECAPLTVIRVLEIVGKPLVATVNGIVQRQQLDWLLESKWRSARVSEANLSDFERDKAVCCAYLRAVMGALAARAVAGIAGHNPKIKERGAPVPLGAVSLILEASGVNATFVIITQGNKPQCFTSLYDPSDPARARLRCGCSEPGILLMYCEDRTHLSLLTWAKGDQAAKFLTASSLPDQPQKLDQYCARLVANGNPRQDLPAMPWCSLVESTSHARTYQGVGVSAKVELTSIRATMSADFSNGRPCGAVDIQFHNGGIHLHMDTERPTAADYEDHPTLVQPGYLWPHPASGSGRRMIRMMLTFRDRMPVLNRDYAVESVWEGEHHYIKLLSEVSCKDELEASEVTHHAQPPILPLAASEGRLEYGYYFAENCTLRLTSDVFFRGSIVGTPSLPFSRNGPGEWMSAKGREEKILLGTWIGGSLIRPEPLRKAIHLQHMDKLQLSLLESCVAKTVRVQLPSTMASTFGKALRVAASVGDTIGQLKTRVSTVTCVGASQLSFGDNALCEDSTMLSETNFTDLGALTLSISGSVPEVTFAIRVTLPDSLQASHGSMLTLATEASSSVGSLKSSLEAALGVAAKQQVLTFDGVTLAPDSATLHSRMSKVATGAVMDCPVCFETFSIKTKAKQKRSKAEVAKEEEGGEGKTQEEEEGGEANTQKYVPHRCRWDEDAPDQKTSERWTWGQKRTRKTKLRYSDDAENDGMGMVKDLEDYLEQANEEAGMATDSALKHVAILGKQGSMVYAATRSHLNVSTLDSAGGSSAYCAVQYCLDNPQNTICFSERCGPRVVQILVAPVKPTQLADTPCIPVFWSGVVRYNFRGQFRCASIFVWSRSDWSTQVI